MTQGEARLSNKLAKALKSVGGEIAKSVVKSLGLGKAAEEEDERAAERAVADADWTDIAKAAQAELVAVATDGAKRTLVILGVDDDESITEQTFTTAVEWAKARAAELVGKSWDGDVLVDNPDAEMAITDSLREEIRSAVGKALEDGDSAAELSDRIEELAGFSEERATMIARTELIRAHGQGQMAAMRESGVVQRKAWSTSNDEDVSDECQENADEGDIALEDDFPSGDDAPPAHPNCRCAVVAVIEEQNDEDESEEDDEEEAAE